MKARRGLSVDLPPDDLESRELMERLGAPGLPAQRHGGADRTLEADELPTEGWPELGSGIRQGLRGTAGETNAVQRVLLEHGSSCQLGPQLYPERDTDGH